MEKAQGISFDWFTIIVYLMLVFLGWMSIYSSSYTLDNPLFSLNTIAGRQLAFMICSFLIGSSILFIDAKLINRLSYLTYFLAMIALVLVLFIGKEVGGAKAWFNFGKFGLQPAEFAKIGTILAIAKFLNDKDLYLDKTRTLIISTSFIIFPVLLILMQPDAGSALVYTALIIMFFREGLPLRYIASIIIVGVLSILTLIIGVSSSIIVLILLTVVLAYLLKKQKKKIMIILIFFIICASVISGVNYTYEQILRPHQKERIDLIIGKEKNELGSGYNLKQSLIAIGSGGFIGKGYLKGTQTKGNFVPEQDTDFIFCTIGEEFGFIGSTLVITLLLTLIIRIILLSEKQTSRFNRIIGYSLASILFAHIFINIGMTTGIVPVIGIPLPFFSYGGSSLLAFSMLLFIFIKFDSCRMERF